MGVDYGWEKFFSSIHYAVTRTERFQQRLQGVVSGIDGLRRDSFPSDETFERFGKLMTATKMLPARGNEGRLAATTSQMEESEARQCCKKQWRYSLTLLRHTDKSGQDLLLFLHIPKQLNRARPMSGDTRRPIAGFVWKRDCTDLFVAGS
jgi:hypothetical protein